MNELLPITITTTQTGAPEALILEAAYQDTMAKLAAAIRAGDFSAISRCGYALWGIAAKLEPKDADSL